LGASGCQFAVKPKKKSMTNVVLFYSMNDLLDLQSSLTKWQKTYGWRSKVLEVIGGQA
jgi:hypothetical protein